MSGHVLAKVAVLDHDAGCLIIDGIRFPWFIEVDPKVKQTEDGVLNVICIGIQVEGPVTIRPAGSSKAIFVDPTIGPVGDFARELVRNGFKEAFPWLKV